MSCADPESFARGGPTPMFLVFFFCEEREDPNTTKSGPSSARQQNATEMAFCWRAYDGPPLNAGLVTL